jgi:hypothetical protein
MRHTPLAGLRAVALGPPRCRMPVFWRVTRRGNRGRDTGGVRNRSLTSLSLEELKTSAGSPNPYRLAVTIFWTAGGLAALSACGGSKTSVLTIGLLIIAMSAGLYFYLRIYQRGLSTFVFLWLIRPSTGVPFIGWLWFRSPAQGKAAERVFAIVAVSALIFALVAASVSGSCSRI